ncbi:hypothetical protein EVAR_24492_1 [Eumeta japonica]|uniref:U4/U6.U5 small nuclear ribonucleoprotein 27 kDa protein n=1 Tax=Eumeta variegata TaxID=151549 RepID=A0A4C1WUT2_EUMVA|nr:hypothetical protein EVAR_24492_1 [Eumeta japonica]
MGRSPSPRRRDRRDRDRDRDRERRRRTRSRSPERRRRSPDRRRSPSPARRRRSRSPSPGPSSSFVPKPKKTFGERPIITPADLEGKTPEEQEMLKIMGFCGFDSTKGKKVEDNVEGEVHVVLKRKYRQYMNRKACKPVVQSPDAADAVSGTGPSAQCTKKRLQVPHKPVATLYAGYYGWGLTSRIVTGMYLDSFESLCARLVQHALLTNSQDVTVRQKVLCALHFFASGSYQRALATGHCVSQQALSDSGYALKPWLLTPITGAPPGSREYQYTKVHAKLEIV